MDREAAQRPLARRDERATSSEHAAGPHTAQLSAMSAALNGSAPVQRLEALTPNHTGMPDTLKAGVEAMSGMSIDHVRVHRNSPLPAQLQAHAFAQGGDIHLGPGQEAHLPHEAWHVVQQAQGRVQPTTQMAGGVPVNDDRVLEDEADRMGALAAGGAVQRAAAPSMLPPPSAPVVQRALVQDAEIIATRDGNYDWRSFRGTRTENFGGTATESGRSAKLVDGVNVRRSHISWGAVDAVSGEGTSVDAMIGPDHNLGSNPSAQNALKRVASFKKLSGESYISGHLLTEKLGGPGNEARNLTAIPGTANSLQSSRIEDNLRVDVNEQGYWMRYILNVDYADKTKAVALAPRAIPAAMGVEATPASGGSTVKVRYASRLVATWYRIDIDGNAATRPQTVTLTITSPLDSADAVASDPVASGAASGKHAIRTKIDAEDLVLTTSNLLKHVVDHREPLIGRIAELRQAIESLEVSEQESAEAMDRLNEEAWEVGRDAGYRQGYNELLAEYELSFSQPPPPMIDDETYRQAYAEGEKAGQEAADAYIRGYQSGYNHGYYDEGAPLPFAITQYDDGFNYGFHTGLEAGEYGAGRRYNIDKTTLLQNLNESHLNVHSSNLGFTTVELTGRREVKNGVKWYQVKLISAWEEGLKEETQKNFWMKRAWLRHGY
ncbi:eCIS core domain-containing protein [Sphingomonas soli]|uniref:eCIS core domain-containing protein n=1 Tax=Sphingomonas soli TaxID=266127 RepID=UPI000A071B31|nr:DUF4157 domain-containing protein [Sphingomonas soli]